MDTSRAVSHLFMLVATIIAIGALYFARVVFVPFALAVVFALLLAPVVTLLDRIHIPRTASSFVVVAVSMFILGGLGWIATGQLVDVANELPAYRSNIKGKAESLYRWRDHGINQAADAVHEIGNDLVTPPSTSAKPESSSSSRLLARENAASRPVRVEVVPPATNPLESLNGFIGPATTFGIVVVFTLFILARREDLRNRFIRLVGHGHLNVLTQALDEASRRVSRYLFLQLSVNIGYGVVVGVGLYFIGIPHAILWGVMAALLRFLPYVGGLLSAALPMLLSLAMFDSWRYPVLTFVLYIGVDVILANVVEPLLYGPRLGLSSLAILVAAVFWTVLWGPIGLVISTPLTVCLVVIGRYVPDLEFLNILLGDEPVLAPESHYYQRLLANDQNEARQVLEAYLKENDLQRLYDSVLIPALALAERDRHHKALDKETEEFIALSTRELIEELGYHHGELTRNTPCNSERGTDADTGSEPATQSIACVPARDEADEIVVTMLAQLAEQAGHRPQCVPIGSDVDFRDGNADVVCISALPPFAVSHARALYARLRAQPLAQNTRILVGLWGFSGDAAKLAERLRLREGDGIFVSLEDVLTEISTTTRLPQGGEGPISPSLVPTA